MRVHSIAATLFGGPSRKGGSVADDGERSEPRHLGDRASASPSLPTDASCTVLLQFRHKGLEREFMTSFHQSHRAWDAIASTLFVVLLAALTVTL